MPVWALGNLKSGVFDYLYNMILQSRFLILEGIYVKIMSVLSIETEGAQEHAHISCYIWTFSIPLLMFCWLIWVLMRLVNASQLWWNSAHCFNAGVRHCLETGGLESFEYLRRGYWMIHGAVPVVPILFFKVVMLLSLGFGMSRSYFTSQMLIVL